MPSLDQEIDDLADMIAGICQRISGGSSRIGPVVARGVARELVDAGYRRRAADKDVATRLARAEEAIRQLQKWASGEPVSL